MNHDHAVATANEVSAYGRSIMKHHTAGLGFVALALAAMSAQADPWWAGGTNGFPSGSTAQPNTGSQRDAQAAYMQARAECRNVSGDQRRDCIAKSQREYDKDRTLPKPPSGAQAPASSVLYLPR
jgi:hypothetical protein